MTTIIKITWMINNLRNILMSDYSLKEYYEKTNYVSN